MRKRIYVAGAYSDNNVLGVLQNIGRGQHFSTQLFALGYAPFCPWLDKEFVIRDWRNKFTVQQFLDYSMAWLDVADCMFVVPNVKGLKDWQQSAGTLKEIEYARKHNIPIFYNVTDIDEYYKRQNKSK